MAFRIWKQLLVIGKPTRYGEAVERLKSRLDPSEDTSCAKNNTITLCWLLCFSFRLTDNLLNYQARWAPSRLAT